MLFNQGTLATTTSGVNRPYPGVVLVRREHLLCANTDWLLLFDVLKTTAVGAH